MKFRAGVLYFSMLVGGLAAQIQAQTLNGPVLGFVSDDAGTAIRPVFGIPGASALGNRLPFNIDLGSIEISPKQDYALAIRLGDRQLVCIDLSSGAPVVRPVVGLLQDADILAISPGGVSAAAYDRGANTVRIIGGLPEAPRVVRQFETSRIRGQASGIAVSDDGLLAIVKTMDAAWIIDASAPPSPVPAQRPAAVAFVPNRRDIVVADEATRSIFMLTNIGKSNARVPLLSSNDLEGILDVAVSLDGQRVFVAVASGNLTVINAASGEVASVSCECRPTALYRMRGSSIFRLDQPSGSAIAVLDASESKPRVVLIPPGVSQ